jgi:hypothetical protein
VVAGHSDVSLSMASEKSDLIQNWGMAAKFADSHLCSIAIRSDCKMFRGSKPVARKRNPYLNGCGPARLFALVISAEKQYPTVKSPFNISAFYAS